MGHRHQCSGSYVGCHLETLPFFFPSLCERRDPDQGKNCQPLLLEVPPEERGGSLPGRFPGSVLHIWVLFRTPNANTCSISWRGHNFNTPDVRLFNISGSIIPPNGSANSSNESFVNLEQIPSRELEFDQDIFCLSEFEYQSEEFRIFVNVIQLYVVSEEGEFCARANGTGPDCNVFYTFQNFVLYYGSSNPTTGEVGRINDECIVVQDILSYRAGPAFDLSINVSRHINKTGLPQNGEPLIMFYPEPINTGLAVSRILSAPGYTYPILVTFQELNSSSNVTCVVQFMYDFLHSQLTTSQGKRVVGMEYHLRSAPQFRRSSWCLTTTRR